MLHELLRTASDPGHGLNLVREYLQARVLATMQRAGAMVPLAFHGGTALRFLYRLPRFSEDLDFALENPTDDFSLRDVALQIRQELRGEGYDVDIKISQSRAVHSAWVRCAGLLHELGLSGRRAQVLGVKIEVDTRPPGGATCSTSVVRRHLTLNLHHHDRASLLAGKLHAILQRPYAKGRDWHDLLWYLADPGWPGPNLTLLTNALQQTGWSGGRLETSTWIEAVVGVMQQQDFAQLHADVEPFVEPGATALTLSQQSLEQVLQRARERTQHTNDGTDSAP